MGAFTLITEDTPRGVNVAGDTSSDGITTVGVLCPDCIAVGISAACGRPVLDPIRGSMQNCGRYIVS